MSGLRISLLHIAPVPNDVGHNRRLVESALQVAAENGADWAITPELSTSGYMFAQQIGTDWILPQPDTWTAGLCQSVKKLGLTLFIGQPERDPVSGKMHNSVFVIDRQGEIAGKHRKVKTLQGAEAWSTPGEDISPVRVGGLDVGILICADGYTNEVAQVLKDKGAQLFVSPVAWGPGPCAPQGEWEQRTLDTGLPVIVCNRSGGEGEDLDYRLAESVVVKGGRRLLTATSDGSVVLTFDWDLERMEPLSRDFQRDYI